MKRLLVIILSINFWGVLQSQPLNSIYDNKTLVSFEKEVYRNDSAFHTSVRPFLISDFQKKFDYHTARNLYNISKYSETEGLDILFNRNLVAMRNEDYGFTIDFLFDFGGGYDTKNNRSAWTNTRGFLVEGYLGKDFAFSTSFYETQAKLPLWIDNYVKIRGNMPGQGRVKPYDAGAWDYANASGYISWTPGNYFNFQLGHGKHFWGDGYRSLILSDVSLYNPYLMITTTFWKFKYINLYSQFSHPDRIDYVSEGDPVYAKKFSTMHYLSFAPNNKWNISIFEVILWQAYDSSFYRGFDFNYLNPVIFYRPIEFNAGSGDNAIIGLNLRYSLTSGIALYGQLVFDEFRMKEIIAGNGWHGNKYAWQAGFKTFDLLGIEYLELQAEYNSIRPYMYSHYTQTQNYSNAKEPLAHPMGANAREMLAIAKYNYKRLYFNAKYTLAAFGLDTSNLNSGKNIFLSYNESRSEYGNYTTQGLYTALNQLDLSVSFLVNPSTNMNLFLAATLRREQNSKMDNTYSYFSFGFRTNLRNLYYDFY